MESINARWFLVWLVSCLAVAVLSAPVNEANSAANNTRVSSDFDAAIAEIRAKREALKKKSISSRFNKYASLADDDGQEGSEEEIGDSGEEDESMASLLSTIDSPAELNSLAKEIALDILMEENAKERRQQAEARSPILKKKKKSLGTSHFNVDEAKRKRANAFFYRLMDEDEENGQDSDDPFGQSEEDQALPYEDNEEDQDVISEQAVARALANQGLDRREIEAIISQLEAQADDDIEGDKRKKKRSGERWKIPRAAPRWRYAIDSDDHLAFQEDDDSEEGRFFGRGFHRMGPGVVDEIGRGTPGASDKRMLRPLKARKALAGIIKKRSVASLDRHADSTDAKVESRKKRSVETVSALDKNETATPPLALPLSSEVSENQSKPAKEEHDIVIRKKSVDWDDYFGFDKRKRSGLRGEEDEENDEAVRDYLENEYYKAIAGSLAYRKKRGSVEHAGHGMMKKSNGTRQSQQHRLNQLRAQMVAHLIDDLEPEDLDEMSDRLSHDLLQVLRDDEEFDDENDDNEFLMKRRSAAVMQPYRKRMPLKKRMNKDNDEKRKRLSVADNVDDEDKRRKRFRIDDDEKRRKRPSEDEEETRRKRLPEKRAPKKKESESDDDECVIAEQVVATCNMVSHLYGGYRPVLSDACFRHQACSICSDNDEACDVEYERRVLALCGPDLLCQSQSRHLLNALNQLEEMEAGFFQGSQRQIQALCRRDSCLAELFKRR